MARVNFTALVPFVLSQSEWEDAIRAAELLVPITLDAYQPDAADRMCYARVGMAPVKFPFVQSEASATARSRRELARYPIFVSTPGSGDIKSWAAGFAALYAYVSRTCGVFFDPESMETLSAAPGIKKQADNLLVACYADRETFYARYPEEREADPGPMYIQATLHT